MVRSLAAALMAATLLACRPAASSGSILLFLGRSPAAHLGALSWAADPDHSRLIGFNAALRAVRVLTSPHLSQPVAVAALGGDLLVSERTGEGVVFDTLGRELREWPAPDPVSVYAVGGEARIVAARSPYEVPFSAEPDTAPLLRVLDTLGHPLEGLATIHIPDVPFLAELANAGAVAVDGGGNVYFAPLTQDAIRKYGRGGQERWMTRRGVYKKEGDPQLPPPRGREVKARYAIANIALALGPDGRLYALGADDSTARHLRLDVLDTASGTILTTLHLGAVEAAVAVDAHGRITTSDAATLAGIASGRREPFGPAFALPDLHGDTVTLARFAGKVTLVDFWASWCDPCREEFPHMAHLYREFDHQDFDLVAISDDVNRSKMLAFVRQFRPPFPILVGGGRMRRLYHYRGLPYSVLLDRRGRIIERLFGFGGAAEFASLRDTIAKEVRAP